MSLDALLSAGIAVAVFGVALQCIYLSRSIADLRRQRRKTRESAEKAAADRAAVEREGRVIAFFIAARIVSSLALMTVHLLIVGSIALVLQATRSSPPSATAFGLAWIRVAVSAVVIVSTASQLAARRWAMRR